MSAEREATVPSDERKETDFDTPLANDEWFVIGDPSNVYAPRSITRDARHALVCHERIGSLVRRVRVVATTTPARPVEGGEAVADWYSVAIDGEKDAQVAFRSRAAAERYVARWHPDCMVAVIEPVRAAPPAPQVTEAMVAPLIEALHGMGYPAIRHADARRALTAALRGGAR